MRLFDPLLTPAFGYRRFGAVLTGVALATAASAATPPLPASAASAASANANPDAVVVSDAPLKHPNKHREVKPGPATPKTWPSKPLPLLETPSQTRSPS